jgi:flavodoxin
MDVHIIYESQYGNTEQIAYIVASVLEPYATIRLHILDTVDLVAVTPNDLLIFGCPTQHHRPSPRMMSYFHRLPQTALVGMRVAVFDTRYAVSAWMSGSAAEVLGREVRHKGGFLVTAPKSFFVTDRQGPLKEGELSRAAEWASLLLLEHRPFLTNAVP